jgi:hypothetical protein
MTEDEALIEAAMLLQIEGNVESGRELLKLQRYISPSKFGDLWSAYIASTTIEVVIALDH